MTTYIIHGRTINGTDARILEGILHLNGCTREALTEDDMTNAAAILDKLPPIVTNDEIISYLAKHMKSCNTLLSPPA